MHTPVGLPIGAKTPAEIAVSIVAEVIAAIRVEGLSVSALDPHLPAQADRPGMRHDWSSSARRPSIFGSATRITGSAARGAGHRSPRRERTHDPVLRRRRRRGAPLRRRGSSARRRHRRRDLPGHHPRASAAAGGRAGGRKDHCGENAFGGAGFTADPVAVLRGADGGRGALRLELPTPAAGHPARRGQGNGHRGSRSLHRGVSGGPADPAVRPLPRAPLHRCC